MTHDTTTRYHDGALVRTLRPLTTTRGASARIIPAGTTGRVLETQTTATALVWVRFNDGRFSAGRVPPSYIAPVDGSDGSDGSDESARARAERETAATDAASVERARAAIAAADARRAEAILARPQGRPFSIWASDR